MFESRWTILPTAQAMEAAFRQRGYDSVLWRNVAYPRLVMTRATSVPRGFGDDESSAAGTWPVAAATRSHSPNTASSPSMRLWRYASSETSRGECTVRHEAPTDATASHRLLGGTVALVGRSRSGVSTACATRPPSSWPGGSLPIAARVSRPGRPCRSGIGMVADFLRRQPAMRDDRRPVRPAQGFDAVGRQRPLRVLRPGIYPHSRPRAARRGIKGRVKLGQHRRARTFREFAGWPLDPT